MPSLNPPAPGTVLIVSYGQPELLQRCLLSAREMAPTWSVRVWDNHSEASPRIRLLAREHPQVGWWFDNRNVGFAAAVNGLAAGTDGDLLLLNPDAELLVPADRLHATLHAMPRTAAVGPMVRSGELPLWNNARRTPGPLRTLLEYSGYAHRLRGLPLSQRYRRPPSCAGYISGACLLVARAAWLEVGAFDERFWLYGEEADWARRARRAGWKVRLLPEIGAQHLSGGTQSAAPTMHDRDGWLFKAQLLYLDKHYGARVAGCFERVSAYVDVVQGRARHGGRR